jgi:hypothetical protein
MEIALSNIKKNLMLVSALLLSSLCANAAQDAVVAVDGSMVYKSADFDSSVIGYLPRGKKVRVSSKPFGAFHRVSLRQGMIGYISDADLVSSDGRPMSELNSAKPLKSKISKDKGRKGKELKQDKLQRRLPVTVAMAVGPTYGLINYRELINRRDYSDQISFFGLKFTTRAGFIDGSFGLELDALYFSGAPAYYGTVSTVAPTGYIAIFDAILTYSLFNFSRNQGAVTVGAGPVLGISETRTEASGQKFKQNRTELGAVINAGAHYRIHPVILKFEPRYYVERSSYLGYHLSVLYAFD